jgi:hypothetical protein
MARTHKSPKVTSSFAGTARPGEVSHQGCNLKQVSWVIPNGDRSDHPGFENSSQDNSTDIDGGPAWVADIINTLGNDPGQCGYWNNTAVFVLKPD